LRFALPALVAISPLFGKAATSLREIVFGAILIAILIWEPGGLAMLFKKLKRYLDLWPFPH
ncbi:MAG: branched-chain amino acid ABC transporter permease, partial [Armatimonadota bacterium]|nr:branched-chain amino acid ABC transporter permease [Armatimonadota bacterium]